MDLRNYPRPIRPLEKRPERDPHHAPDDSLSGGEEQGPRRRQQKRKRLACKGCRQAKIRCDVSSLTSGPCARCRRMKLECVVDAGFKRITKRQKVQDFGGPVQQLLSPVETHYGASYTSVANQSSGYIREIETVGNPQVVQVPNCEIPNISFTPSINEHPSFDTLSTVPGSGISNFSVTAPSPQSLQRHDGARKLGHLIISNSEISELFKIFFDKYHPHLSILDPSLSPNEYYTRSSVLFWVIISIGSRQYEPEPTLVTSLASPVMKLLWNSVSKLPPTPALIQAILLISAWPFPATTMWENPSYILISVAKAAITQLGLHRPETVSDFSRVKRKMSTREIQEAIKIWAGCYVVAQGLIVSIGQQPLLTVDWAIDRACEVDGVYALPDDFRHQLLITQFSGHITQVMSENRRSPTGLPSENEISTLLAILEREFEDLNRRLSGKLNPINQIQLTCTHLQLLTFHFFSNTPTRQRGLLRSYNTAYSLITQTATHTASPLNFMLHTPSHYGQILVLAGVILLKILHSSFVAYVDFASGKRAFNSAVTLLRNASIEDNDLSGRGSKILAQLWSVHASLGSKVGHITEPDVRMKTRSSASVMHDALWAWREKFARQGSPARLGSTEPQSRDETVFVNDEDVGEESQVRDRNFEELDLDQAFGLTADLEDMGSIWDMNIPSLLPIDLDAYNFS